MFRTVLPVVAASALAATPLAQSLYTVDEGGQVIQQNGPAAGVCNLPPGPLLGEWGHSSGGFCVGTVPLGSGFAGDVAMDRASDLLYVTDGTILEEFFTYGSQSNGLFISGILTNPVTGLAFDPTSGELWITDGASLAAFLIGPDIDPFLNPCSTGPTLTVPSVPLPLAGGATATAMDYDPFTDTLWVCDDLGFVTNVTKAGALGPAGSFDAASASPCGLAAPLKAIAVDAAAPAGRVYVSDGAQVAYLDLAGGGATSFYTTTSCYAPQGATLATPTPLAAMTFAATPITFGTASFGFDPIIGVNGQSVVPNPNFQVVLAGLFGTLDIGDIAVLGASIGPVCPPITALGAPINIDLSASIILASTALGDPPYLEFPAPISSALPVGNQVFFQWGVIDPVTLGVLTTKGLAVTTSRP